MEEKRVMLGNASGEIIEKKSRFIATAMEIHSEEEALRAIESLRKRYYDARHNCYAYVLGERDEIQRFSDDKEPQGTAGKPILEVIRSRGYHNTLIVVTRYFGGILLGAGGLLRAYSAAASEALKQAEETGVSSPVSSGQELKIVCDYNHSGKIQYQISQLEIPVSSILYEARVTFHLVVPTPLADSFCKKISEATNAASEIIPGSTVTYILKNNIPTVYSWDLS